MVGLSQKTELPLLEIFRVPDWCMYFLELGWTLAHKDTNEGSRVCAILTLPTDSFAAVLIAAGCVLGTESLRPPSLLTILPNSIVVFQNQRWHYQGPDSRGMHILAPTKRSQSRTWLPSTAQLTLPSRSKLLATLLGNMRAARLEEPGCDVAIIGGLEKLKDDTSGAVHLEANEGQQHISLGELLGARVQFRSSRRGLLKDSSDGVPHCVIFADPYGLRAKGDSCMFDGVHQIYLISRTCASSRHLADAATDEIIEFRQSRGNASRYLDLPSAPPGIEWEAFQF
jgi:hypothetical protein